MKLLLLHLSDLHMSQTLSHISDLHITKLIAALNTMPSFDKVAIIVSGDLTQSAANFQFSIFNRFMNDLFAKIKSKHPLCGDVDLYFVPGNHDVNLKEGLNHKEISNIISNGVTSEDLKKEYDRQKNFFSYAKRKRLIYDDSGFLCQKIVNYDGVDIEFNLVNSAFFSSLEEEKGLHYITPEAIERITKPTNAKIVISVMHHAIEWFEPTSKQNLKEALLSKSSLLYLGHEHITSANSVTDFTSSHIILTGGQLCNNGDWENSEFHASILDTTTLSFSHYAFSWSKTSQQYIHQTIIEDHNLPNNPSTANDFHVSLKFKEQLCKDSKISIDLNLFDYFVFPKLRSSSPNPTQTKDLSYIQNSEQLIQTIKEQKVVLISGAEDSGKTTLLKHIFKQLENDYACVFFDAREMSGRPDRNIRNAFEDVYGDNYEDFERFLQLDKEKKVLLLDNSDSIRKQEKLDLFLEYAKQKFEYIVLTSTLSFETDIIQRVKALLDDQTAIAHYRLQQFYRDKRKNLVSKMVLLLSPKSSGNHCEIIKLLCDGLQQQQYLTSYTPAFIIKYVLYYIRNGFSSASLHEMNIFSKVFEANLVECLRPHLGKSITPDKAFTIIGKIAYETHISRKYPIHQTTIENVIEKYNDEYGSKIDPRKFFDSLVESHILIPNNGFYFQFMSNSVLAYFVACELIQNLSSTSGQAVLSELFNNCCFTINADILLFVIYKIESPELLSTILEQINKATADWQEYDVKTNNLAYLQRFAAPEITPPTETDKKNADQLIVEHEEITAENYDFNAVSIYEYDIEEVDTWPNQFAKALAMLILISRALPYFEHHMKKDLKTAYAHKLYELPNQIFFYFAKHVQDNLPNLVAAIQEDKLIAKKKDLTPEKIQEYIQLASLGILLELYGNTAFNACHVNTSDFLLEHEHNQKETYTLECLWFQKKLENSTSFFTEASRLFQKTESDFVKTATQLTVKQYMIDSEVVSASDIQRLSAKFFIPDRERKSILMLRQNNR